MFYLAFPSIECLIKTIQIKKSQKEMIFQILKLCMLFIPEYQYKVSFKIEGVIFSKKISLYHSREFLIK